MLHPPILTAPPVGLNSSTNSSLLPSGPRERNSLMTRCAGAIGVREGVDVSVGERVGVNISVIVLVYEGVGVRESVFVALGVRV